MVGVSTKRKNDENPPAPGPAKKARGATANAASVALVNSILANPKGYPISGNEDVIRKSLVDLASYARYLEQQIAGAPSQSQGAGASGTTAVKAARTQAQLAEAAEKLRKAAVSGIKKQMSWKPSCKTGSAKWCYDGICTDPEVFGALLKLGGPPKFKMRKFTAEEFQNCLGEIQGSVRYDTLYITSKDVNVRWSDTGEFKFSGSYGRYQPSE